MSEYIDCPCNTMVAVGPVAKRMPDGYVNVLALELYECASCGARWLRKDGGPKWAKNTHPDFQAWLAEKEAA